jgi:hypothetical protein
MLKSAKASTLIYPQQSSLKSTPESHGSLNFRGYDASAFQSNMTIVASLSDNHQYDDGKIVVAYNGSTVVGVSSRCDEKFFIVAGGNTTAQTLTFALVDTLTGQRLDFENQLAYSTDGVQGTIDAPYLLTSKTSLDAANVNNTFISVTPTVFSNKLTVSASIAVVTTMRVRVLDVLGRELCAIEQAASTISLDEIATTLAPGTYSVEVTTGNEKVVTKVVK